MSDPIFENYARGGGKQTFIIPLTYPDISLGAKDIERIGYGGDVWEVRVDLLSDAQHPLGATNPPSYEYVRQQVSLLQTLSPLPILFTIRTFSQGGKFPDDAVDEALALMLLAVELNCLYIDVEIEWPQQAIDTLVAAKGASKLVASFHSWTGDIRWTSSTLQEKYALADSFGDIIKLSILSVDVYDCHELALFVRTHDAHSKKPLLAVGMGQHGQLSRTLSPISLVTHKLLPAPSAPGQLTPAEVHVARHLIGQLPKKELYVAGSDEGAVQFAAQAHRLGLDELGLPHRVSVIDRASLERTVKGPAFGGAAVIDSLVSDLGDFVDEISDSATKSGLVDTVHHVTGSSGKSVIMGDNILCRSLCSLAQTSIVADSTPLSSAKLILVGVEEKLVRTVLHAARELGIKDFYAAGPSNGDLHDISSTLPTSDSHPHALSTAGSFSIVVVGSLQHPELSQLSLESKGVLINLGGSKEDQRVRHHIPTKGGWKFFSSEDVRNELIFQQFTLWTGRPAPKKVMIQGAAA